MPQNRTERPLGVGLATAQPLATPSPTPQGHTQKTVRLSGEGSGKHHQGQPRPPSLAHPCPNHHPYRPYHQPSTPSHLPRKGRVALPIKGVVYSGYATYKRRPLQAIDLLVGYAVCVKRYHSMAYKRDIMAPSVSAYNDSRLCTTRKLLTYQILKRFLTCGYAYNQVPRAIILREFIVNC